MVPGIGFTNPIRSPSAIFCSDHRVILDIVEFHQQIVDVFFEQYPILVQYFLIEGGLQSDDAVTAAKRFDQ